MNFNVFEDGNVSKYVFTGKDFVAESVLYKYGSYYDRTVICCSTQSGCKVGCGFCGTGKQFIRNLTSDEIVNQILDVLKDKNIEDVDTNSKRFQIMFMSMGEPMHNWDNVSEAIKILNNKFKNADLLISTIGVDDIVVAKDVISLSYEINKIGLQFSIHKSSDEDRNKLIPYEQKMNLRAIRDFGMAWNKITGRKVYLNYCIDGKNNTKDDVEKLKSLFSPLVFNFTFSVISSKAEDSIGGYVDINKIREFENSFVVDGYDTRIFNPDGQDTIGAGCGQLWFTQSWIKKYKEYFKK